MDPSQQPYPLHWAAALAPFANVGLVTFKPNGVGDGYYWIYIGALPHASYDPIADQVTITELNKNWTGKFTYVANLPGGLSATVEERFIVFDNGREFRSVPTSIQNVFFNQGKEYFSLALDDPTLPPDQQGIKFSFGWGKRIGQ